MYLKSFEKVNIIENVSFIKLLLPILSHSATMIVAFTLQWRRICWRDLYLNKTARYESAHL